MTAARARTGKPDPAVSPRQSRSQAGERVSTPKGQRTRRDRPCERSRRRIARPSEHGARLGRRGCSWANATLTLRSRAGRCLLIAKQARQVAECRYPRAMRSSRGRELVDERLASLRNSGRRSWGLFARSQCREAKRDCCMARQSAGRTPPQRPRRRAASGILPTWKSPDGRQNERRLADTSGRSDGSCRNRGRRSSRAGGAFRDPVDARRSEAGREAAWRNSARTS